MAVNAPKTIVVYDITGQTDYTIPFEYLARKFVVVTLIGQDRLTLTLNTDYRFTTKTTIGLTNPSPVGYDKIEIRRFTSATERLVDFHDGSILRAYDLNLSQIQTLHVAEESRDLAGDSIGVNDDGNLDARGRRIVNLANAVDDTDAVNYAMLKLFDESTFNNAQRAAASEAASKLSETKSKASEVRSIQAEATSVASANTAVTAAIDANSSKLAAEAAESTVTPLVPIVEKASQDAAQAATDAAQAVQDVKALGAVPIGTIATFIKAPPAGYLKCDGSTFSQSEYPELYAYLGTNVLPDLNGRYLKQPSDAANLNQGFNAQMPDHQHDVTPHTHGRGSMEITGSIEMHSGTVATNIGIANGGFYSARGLGQYRDGGSLYSGAPSIGVIGFEASRTWSGRTTEELLNTQGIKQSSLSIAVGQVLEVKHHTVIFAIKAAGKVSDEGLMEVTQIKADVARVESEYKDADADLSGRIDSLTTEVRKYPTTWTVVLTEGDVNNLRFLNVPTLGNSGESMWRWADAETIEVKGIIRSTVSAIGDNVGIMLLPEGYQGKIFGGNNQFLGVNIGSSPTVNSNGYCAIESTNKQLIRINGSIATQGSMWAMFDWRIAVEEI